MNINTSHHINNLFSKIGKHHFNQSFSKLNPLFDTIFNTLIAIDIPEQCIQERTHRVEEYMLLQKRWKEELTPDQRSILSSKITEMLTRTYLWIVEINSHLMTTLEVEE